MPDHRLVVGPRDGERGERGTRIVQRDGSGKRVIDGRPVGWIAGALGGER